MANNKRRISIELPNDIYNILVQTKDALKKTINKNMTINEIIVYSLIDYMNIRKEIHMKENSNQSEENK